MLTKEQYEEVKKLQCPYCALSLPELSDTDVFWHIIPGTGHKFECTANEFRRNYFAKYCTKNSNALT